MQRQEKEKKKKKKGSNTEVTTGMERAATKKKRLWQKKKCHNEWKLLNMPFGKPFFSFPEATVGNMLSAYFSFGSQGHVLSGVQAWESTLILICCRLLCPGCEKGYFSFNLTIPTLQKKKKTLIICMKLPNFPLLLFFLSSTVLLVLVLPDQKK